MTKFNRMAVAAMALAVAATASATETPKAETVFADSCSAAFATIMAQYIKPDLLKHFEADSANVAEFSAGVAHAFEIKDADAPYFYGVRSGLGLIDRVEQMQQMGFPITGALFAKDLGEAIAGQTYGFDVESADAYLRSAMARLFPEPEALSAESQQAYIDENRARQGVETTPSGLLFEVITEGEGNHPRDTDTVSVTYTGRLSDGTVFDSTERPVQFPVNRLVPGFTEGLKLMKPGGTYRLIIPSELGYGDAGAAGVIPPGAVLDFTVTLNEILPQQPQ